MVLFRFIHGKFLVFFVCFLFLGSFCLLSEFGDNFERKIVDELIWFGTMNDFLLISLGRTF